MRRVLTALCMIMILALQCDLLLAGGNHRFALERKAKRAAECEKEQAKRLKACDKESENLLKKFDADKQLIRPGR
jgi:hypothetical protein